MYSLEQRRRAVELYIKHGLKATTTIRELGHPSRVRLAAWHREWLETGGSIHERSRASEAYSAEQKRAAVDHYLEHGVFANVGVDGTLSRFSTLRSWAC